ncbi:MAG: HAMP domain-containing sensor histidine kinase [Acidimicrobiales bacterium]
MKAERTRRRVLELVCAHLVVGAALLGRLGLGDDAFSTPILTLAAFAAGYALLDLIPLHLEFRRHAHTITITEAVIVASAFHMEPAGVVAAAVVGELIACLKNRLQPLQLTFNVAQTFGAAAVAITVFSAVGPADVTSGWAWAAAFAAAACFATVSMISVASVLTIVEGTPFRQVVGVTSASTGITALASAALGLALLTLADGSAAAPLLLAPVVALVVLESKRVTDASAERLRFQRLYEASSRTARLSRLEEAVTVLASEARELLTGAQAICCAKGEDGSWSGVIVDDAGSRALDATAVEELRSVSGDSTVELAWQQVPTALRAVCARDSEVVVAPSDPTTGGQVLLAVVAPHGGEQRQSGLAEVLSAFAGTAALAVSNAALYAEVEAALRHQIDLNRQKAEFVAAVSHELRTPLASVLGSVQTIRRLGSRLAADDADELLEAALAQGARLRRLIEDLLLVAAAEHRTAHHQANPIDPVATLRELEDQFRAASGGQRLRVVVDPDVNELCTDEDKLQRVLTNLVENAVKYAPDGPIELRCAKVAGGTRFTVTDSGPGIPAHERERIFERFVQLDQSSTRRQGGTGLGLHLCRNVAELLGGSLIVCGRGDDQPGAQFVLTLPTQSAIPGPPEPQPHQRDAEPFPDRLVTTGTR